MQQLTELDYAFIQAESPRTPFHISPVMVYEPRRGKGGKVRFKEILRAFERSLPKSAIFRRKLVNRTLGLDVPWWVEDPDFDLEFHVRHIALPKPGDWRQFCILLARLHARGLDLSRPLWEAYVIEGLNGIDWLPQGSFAIMLKVHHSAIDGVSGAEIVAALHSLSPEIEPPAPEDDWQGETDPSAVRLWSRAYVNTLRRPVRLVETVSELVPALRRAGNLRQPGHQQDADDSVTRTRFNGRVGPHRVTDAIIMELDDIKRIKSSVEGATVNDAIVSIVGGAMRKYLQSKGELPHNSLKCGAPINLRSERSADSRGNEVGFMMLDMATDIEDPLERLRAVAQDAKASKAYSSAVGANAMMDLTSSLVPGVIGLGIRAGSLIALLDRISMPAHTVVSNVPGVQQPLYLVGARVHMMMGMGPLYNGLGLFHAVVSTAGRITVNFVACRDLMPDPEVYRDCLQQAYEELSAGIRKRRRRKSG